MAVQDLYLWRCVRLGSNASSPFRLDVPLLLIRYDSWFTDWERFHWPNEAIRGVKQNDCGSYAQIFWGGGAWVELSMKVKGSQKREKQKLMQDT